MLYQIPKKDLATAASVLSSAFSDYPIFNYVLPPSPRRQAKLEYIFAFILKLGMRKGEVLAPNSRIEGVSIWIPPVHGRTSLLDALKSGLFSLGLKLGAKSLRRFIEIQKCKQKARTPIFPPASYFLDTIGVAPRHQGRGVAGAMLKSKLEILDKQKKPCYLETCDKNNLAFYGKFGFRLIHQYKLITMDVFCLYRS